MDITEFIAARLDEDEAAANAGARRVGMPWRAEPQPGTPGGLVIDELGLVGSTGGRYAAEHIARHDPARALREVKAKRAIVRRCGWSVNEPDQYPNGLVSPRAALSRQNLFDLAAVWSDHPDYRDEWRP